MNARSFGQIIFFVFFAVFLAGLIIYFARPDYPIRRVIKNTEGKPLDALIKGKIADTVYFTRMPDREEFSLTLDKLSFRDRVLITILKDQAPPKKAEPVSAEYSDSYIENREKEIGALRKKLEVMQLEFQSRTLDRIMENEYTRRITAIKKDIRELEVAIETRRYRLKKEK